jgi:hypothetical protein
MADADAEVLSAAGKALSRQRWGPSRTRRLIAELRERQGDLDAEQRSALLEIARGSQRVAVADRRRAGEGEP